MSNKLQIWARVGVTIDLTQEQRDRMTSPQEDLADTFAEIFQEALHSNSVCLEGDAYVPGCVAEEFWEGDEWPEYFADEEDLDFDSGLEALQVRKEDND